ncbi:hypothetical protein JOE25_004268 [Serratia sp. PL17]|uniref:hypothetical protein n=1 Tax=Serratia sp. PL17 TaxID=2806582 RepID=UPI001B627E7D|nr:hypothetical protein [Serratia sp. PL17]MBP1132662.1 hypothetical protein [Serratia sp. PL17]
MNNKLSELSKPVCTDERPCINCFSGNGPCTVENVTAACDMKDPVAYSWIGYPNRKKLTRLEPEQWKQPRNIERLYSQEYVSALLAELEAKDKRIAELDGILEVSQGDLSDTEDAMHLWAERAKTAEAKLATPVRLPKTNGYWTEQEKAFENAITLAKRAVRKAGFTVEGDE